MVDRGSWEIMSSELIHKISGTFQSLTETPENYLSVQEDAALQIRQLTKILYDLNKGKELDRKVNPEVLDELIVEDFDEEQIWQQIELQNKFVCQELVSYIPQLLVKKNKLNFGIGGGSGVGDDDDDDNDTGDGGDRSEEGEESTADDGNDDIGNSDSSSDADSDDVDEEDRGKGSAKIKSSIVDDKFFKLREMERFLEKEERSGKDVVGDEDEDDDDDDDDDNEIIDYFKKYSSDDEGDDRENDFHYQDFFDPPDDVQVKRKRRKNRSDGESEPSIRKKKKKVKFSLDNDRGEYDRYPEDDAPSSDEDESEPEGGDHGQKDKNDLSTFEARQERLRSRIKALEEEALKEKPWQMKGEVTAATRPQNSLLEEYVEFDTAVRPAPVMTEKTTLKLEDIIKQRIKDKVWDDVERKIKPVENPREYKKRLVLDQEKSKLSLAQIYEQEYLKQKEASSGNADDKPEETPKEHVEIENSMKKLFSKLDALSNFHFTPKMASTEVKVISNLPAITVEEVAPVATTDASLLAPEEVKSKMRGDLIGKTERTKTDKKRERRMKKKQQRIKQKEIEKREKAKIDNKKDFSKKSTVVQKNLMRKLKRSSNVTQLKDGGDGKYIKSSNVFFSRLQDEVKRHVKAKSGGESKLGGNKQLDAKKLKL